MDQIQLPLILCKHQDDVSSSLSLRKCDSMHARIESLCACSSFISWNCYRFVACVLCTILFYSFIVLDSEASFITQNCSWISAFSHSQICMLHLWDCDSFSCMNCIRSHSTVDFIKNWNLKPVNFCHKMPSGRYWIALLMAAGDTGTVLSENYFSFLITFAPFTQFVFVVLV